MNFIFIIISLTSIILILLARNIFLKVKLNIENKKNSDKQNFLANVVHDLKTPTNAQFNTLKQLDEGFFGNLNEEQHQMINLTKESCEYMSDLISSIMTTYTYDLGKIKLKKTNFDIIELIYEIINSTSILIKTNDKDIQIISDCECCYIFADRLQIKRVLLNLLSNAITYSLKNTIIEIHIEISKNTLEFYIKNISKQIPKKELDKVFDKFKTTKYATFNKVSTGLGLYLSKQLILQHRGNIYAKSYSNGTCIFGFKIPLNNKVNKLRFCDTISTNKK